MRSQSNRFLRVLWVLLFVLTPVGAARAELVAGWIKTNAAAPPQPYVAAKMDVNVVDAGMY